MIRAIYNDVTYETETVDEMLALLGRSDTYSESAGPINWWSDTESDWVDWNGGECPVDKHLIVEVKYRSGETGDDAARYFDWNRHGSMSDVMAYRVVKQ